MNTWDKEEVWAAIHEISAIKSSYNLFDIEERGKYHACGIAIQALRE